MLVNALKHVEKHADRKQKFVGASKPDDLIYARFIIFHLPGEDNYWEALYTALDWVKFTPFDFLTPCTR